MGDLLLLLLSGLLGGLLSGLLGGLLDGLLSGLLSGGLLSGLLRGLLSRLLGGSLLLQLLLHRPAVRLLGRAQSGRLLVARRSWDDSVLLLRRRRLRLFFHGESFPKGVLREDDAERGKEFWRKAGGKVGEGDL